MKRTERAYVGIDKDAFGGMNPTGNIIRDAWVFGLLPETETCEGWLKSRIEELYNQVDAAWEPYGHMVSLLPPELAERHRRIYDEAIRIGRQKGWDPARDVADESA